MKIQHIAAVALMLSASVACAGSAAGPDDAQIRELEARQESAWNAHDAKAYAALFTADADTVNVLGWWWKGREELQQKLGIGFQYVFARSRLHLDAVNVRYLTDKVAIVHVRWSMTGAVSPDGSASNVPHKGIQTQTVLKSNEGWQIAAFHNVNEVPERPFPIAPGSATR